MSQDRAVLFHAWLIDCLQTSDFVLEPLAGDASFRRYCRVRLSVPHRQTGSTVFMAMDAPTEVENSEPFVAISHMLMDHGVRVPAIIAEDLAQGFILLEDFGDVLLSQRLSNDTADALYGMAMQQLIPLQHTPQTTRYPLPHYNSDKLITEMRLFDTWFVPQFLAIDITADVQAMLTQTYQDIAANCVTQPQVVVHRDYHCRNLMVLQDDTASFATADLGIIDFQDAVIGPVTYDLVSILRDAYVSWSPSRVDGWVASFLTKQQAAGYLQDVSITQLQTWFDVMGAQRHLKVLGIFVRLCSRDGKTGYLKDLPLVLWYLVHETTHVPMLQALHLWLREIIVPAFVRKVPESMMLFADVLPAVR